jgi:hypothetical protein
MTTDPGLVFCTRCAAHHRATVALGEGGYPVTTWLEPHHPPTTRADAVDRMGEAGGQAMAIAMDAGRWAEVERILGRVLEINDPGEDR